MDKIILHGMEFYAYHGCFPEEKIVGTRFKVDLVLHADLSNASQSDDLTQTVNYQQVYALVKTAMEHPANILESLCFRIIQAVKLQFPQVERCEVTLYKLNPALGGKTEWVAVTLEQ